MTNMKARCSNAAATGSLLWIVREPRSVTPAGIVRERGVQIVELGIEKRRNEGQMRLEGVRQRCQILQ